MSDISEVVVKIKTTGKEKVEKDLKDISKSSKSIEDIDVKVKATGTKDVIKNINKMLKATSQSLDVKISKKSIVSSLAKINDLYNKIKKFPEINLKTKNFSKVRDQVVRLRKAASNIKPIKIKILGYADSLNKIKKVLKDSNQQKIISIKFKVIGYSTAMTALRRITSATKKIPAVSISADGGGIVNLNAGITTLKSNIKSAGHTARNEMSSIKDAQKKMFNEQKSFIQTVAGSWGLGKMVEVTKLLGDSLTRVRSQTNLFNRIFNGTTKASEGVRKLTKEFGKSEFAIKSVMATIGSKVPTGFMPNQIAEMSSELTKIAFNISKAFNNIGIDQITQKLAQALSGEFEGLRDIGIIIDTTSDKFKNMVKYNQEMYSYTERNARALAIYELILEKSTKYSGLFAEDAMNISVIIDKLSETLQTGVLAKAGEYLSNVLGPILVRLNEILEIPIVQKVGGILAAIVAFGLTIKAIFVIITTVGAIAKNDLSNLFESLKAIANPMGTANEKIIEISRSADDLTKKFQDTNTSISVVSDSISRMAQELSKADTGLNAFVTYLRNIKQNTGFGGAADDNHQLQWVKKDDVNIVEAEIIETTNKATEKIAKQSNLMAEKFDTAINAMVNSIFTVDTLSVLPTRLDIVRQTISKEFVNFNKEMQAELNKISSMDALSTAGKNYIVSIKEMGKGASEALKQRFPELAKEIDEDLKNNMNILINSSLMSVRKRHMMIKIASQSNEKHAGIFKKSFIKLNEQISNSIKFVSDNVIKYGNALKDSVVNSTKKTNDAFIRVKNAIPHSFSIISNAIVKGGASMKVKMHGALSKINSVFTVDKFVDGVLKVWDGMNHAASSINKSSHKLSSSIIAFAERTKEAVKTGIDKMRNSKAVQDFTNIDKGIYKNADGKINDPSKRKALSRSIGGSIAGAISYMISSWDAESFNAENIVGTILKTGAAVAIGEVLMKVIPAMLMKIFALVAKMLIGGKAVAVFLIGSIKAIASILFGWICTIPGLIITTALAIAATIVWWDEISDFACRMANKIVDGIKYLWSSFMEHLANLINGDGWNSNEEVATNLANKITKRFQKALDAVEHMENELNRINDSKNFENMSIEDKIKSREEDLATTKRHLAELKAKTLENKKAMERAKQLNVNPSEYWGEQIDLLDKQKREIEMMKDEAYKDLSLAEINEILLKSAKKISIEDATAAYAAAVENLAHKEEQLNKDIKNLKDKKLKNEEDLARSHQDMIKKFLDHYNLTVQSELEFEEEILRLNKQIGEFSLDNEIGLIRKRIDNLKFNIEQEFDIDKKAEMAKNLMRLELSIYDLKVKSIEKEKKLLEESNRSIIEYLRKASDLNPTGVQSIVEGTSEYHQFMTSKGNSLKKMDALTQANLTQNSILEDQKTLAKEQIGKIEIIKKAVTKMLDKNDGRVLDVEIKNL